jgi:hypothetical protein
MQISVKNSMKCESMSLLPWHVPNKILARSIWVTKESALTTLGKYGSISYAQYLPERAGYQLPMCTKQVNFLLKSLQGKEEYFLLPSPTAKTEIVH